MTTPPVRRGSWLVTLALAGGGLTYLFCSFLPNARAIHALRQETESRHRFGVQSPLLIAATARLQKQLLETNNYIAENRARLPDTGRLPELGSRLTRQADLAGARTTHFEPAGPKELAELRTVSVVFDSQGNFAQICGLLAGLESLPERIWVDDVRVESSQESGKDEQCNLKLTVFADNSDKSD